MSAISLLWNHIVLVGFAFAVYFVWMMRYYKWQAVAAHSFAWVGLSVLVLAGFELMLLMGMPVSAPPNSLLWSDFRGGEFALHLVLPLISMIVWFAAAVEIFGDSNAVRQTVKAVA